MTPVAWMLINVQTGKADTTKAYVREEVARISAKARSSQWRQFVAAPVFLTPDMPSETMLAMVIRDNIRPGEEGPLTDLWIDCARAVIAAFGGEK